MYLIAYPYGSRRLINLDSFHEITITNEMKYSSNKKLYKLEAKNFDYKGFSSTIMESYEEHKLEQCMDIILSSLCKGERVLDLKPYYQGYI